SRRVLHIGVKEVAARLVAPRESPRSLFFHLLAESLPPPPERRPGEIVEGPQHPGDIAQRRGLRAALMQRALRLTLEIDDRDVVLTDQDLAQVIVAMDARDPA